MFPYQEGLGRNPDLLDSSLGYFKMDIDQMWCHYCKETHILKFMFIEEKTNDAVPYNKQRDIIRLLDFACFETYKDGKIYKKLSYHITDSRIDYDITIQYHGFHCISFQNTNPLDGRIWLNKMDITEPDLQKFLQFDIPTVNKYRFKYR
jgi:hypothetical protein